MYITPAELNTLRARAVQFSHTGIVITDAMKPGNPIIDCNPAFEIITGYAKSEIMGRNCNFLQHDDVDQSTLSEIRLAIVNQVHLTVIIKNYRKNGQMFWDELTISPVFNEHDKLTHFIGTQNNVTVRETARLEQSRQNLELSTLNDALRQKNQQQKAIDSRINDLLRQSHINGQK
jgi:PAS domain S-box-containing protein